MPGVNATPEEIKRLRTQLHGFFSWWDFTRATVSILITLSPFIIGAATWGANYAMSQLDLRYASIDIIEQVKSNGEISLQAQKFILNQEIEKTQRILCDTATEKGYRAAMNLRKRDLIDSFEKLFEKEPYIPTCAELGFRNGNG